jgi:hypothetical protein
MNTYRQLVASSQAAASSASWLIFEACRVQVHNAKLFLPNEHSNLKRKSSSEKHLDGEFSSLSAEGSHLSLGPQGPEEWPDHIGEGPVILVGNQTRT